MVKAIQSLGFISSQLVRVAGVDGIISIYVNKSFGETNKRPPIEVLLTEKSFTETFEDYSIEFEHEDDTWVYKDVKEIRYSAILKKRAS